MFFATIVSLFTQQTVNNIPGCHYCLQYNKRKKSASMCPIIICLGLVHYLSILTFNPLSQIVLYE